MSPMSQNAKSIPAASLNDVEPRAGSATMPIWMLVTLLMLVFGGGLYFDGFGGGFNPQVYAPYHSLNQLTLFQPASGADRALQRGKVVYEQVCALCHGADGNGKPGQAPTFVGSEWVIGDSTGRLIRIPLQGLNGPIKVKGVEWNLAMPAMGAALPDEDLAAVLTYMRNAWGNKASEITPEQVKEVRAATASRTQPWTAAELEALK
jgi:mono/diheme cytochrome c family protein